MKLIRKILFVLFLGLIGFVLFTFYKCGVFRKIEPSNNFKVHKSIDLPGVEDMAVDYQEEFVILSSTERLGFPMKEQEVGGLYYLDLANDKFKVQPLTEKLNFPFAPHGIDMYKKDSSTYVIMAINHTLDYHSIEVFHLINQQELKHIETIKGKALVSPNDIVMIDENRYYFTNDHKYPTGLGRLAEDYLGWAVSNVVYFDGQDFVLAADYIAFANGINYDPTRQLLFVTAPRNFQTKVYQVEQHGDLTFVEDIPCNTGVDNIIFDEAGDLWIGAHPNLLAFTAYAQGQKAISPSEVIKINYKQKGDYKVESIYVENGELIAASSAALPFKNYLLVGNVKDEAFVILKE